MSSNHYLRIGLAVVASLLIWLLPPEYYGLEGISTIEQRMAAISVFAVIMWTTEAIPIWTTSVLVIVLMLFTVSTSMPSFLCPGEMSFLETLAESGAISDEQASRLYEIKRQFGSSVEFEDIMATFAHPTLMLFMGGFVLSIGSKSSGLDIDIARMLLKRFGSDSKIVLLGFMIVTATLSMFISNTATAAVMLTIVAPLLRSMPDEKNGGIALTMAVAVASNVGGMGTPIGTPPNAIALRYLNDPHGLDLGIGFGHWMMVMVPLVFFIIIISWLVITWMFPFKQKRIYIELPKAREGRDAQKIIVAATFVVTLFLWIVNGDDGVDPSVVGMLPIAVFCFTGIVGRQELRDIHWDVLWLAAGGFALSLGLSETGLGSSIVRAIPFSTNQPLTLIIGSGILCYVISSFMSHTASAALLIPILGSLCMEHGELLEPYGGALTLIICIALSTSMAMALPISTPPNALAYTFGRISQTEMLKSGLLIGIIGLATIYFGIINFGCNGLHLF